MNFKTLTAMKEIQGKIRFGVIEISNGVVPAEDFMSISEEKMVDSVIFSEITEEQAAEFIEGYGTENGWRNYLVESQYYEALKNTAKESLISLLKANDIWIKEWIYIPDGNCWSMSNADYMDRADRMIRKDNAPDDLLLS